MIYIALFLLAYYLMGELTMIAAVGIYHEPGAPRNTFWEAGYLWPVLLPPLILVWVIAVCRTIANWPRGPESS